MFSLRFTLLFLCAGLAFAQLPTGTILGVVQDSSGAVVASAQGTVTNTETGLSRKFTTETDGTYRVAALPVGTYRVDISSEGFKTFAETGLTLTVSQEAVVNVTLEVGAAQQRVEVTAQATEVNTTNATVGSLVGEQKIQDLPLNGRNPVTLTLLQPGVTQASPNPQGGTYFTVNGAPIRSNTILIDGASMQTEYGAQVTVIGGSNLGLDGIQEYRVITNTFGPEYGMVMGSVTTIVSKSGTNRFHGDAFDYLRNSAMDARNFFDPPTAVLGRRIPLYQRNQFGGAFGGPIKKDKAFFHVVFEELKDNLNVAKQSTVPRAACHTPVVNGQQVVDNQACLGLTTPGTRTVAPVIVPLLALFPSPNSPGNLYSWIFPQFINEKYGQARYDQNFSPADTFFTRFTADYEDSPRGLNYPSIPSVWDSGAIFITASENHIFTSNFLNQARASFSHTSIAFVYSANNLIGPQYSFGPGQQVGGINIGSITGFNPPAVTFPFINQNVYTLSDDLFLTRGRHSIKFGVLFNRFDTPIQTNSNTIGTISFNNLSDFISGLPASFQRSAVDPGIGTNRNFRYYTAGFYVGDDYRPISRLTLNLGLRYEFLTTPHDTNGRDYAFRDIAHDSVATIVHGDIMRNPSYKNFSPRIGFAWDVTGKGTTSIRGGGGIYYDIAGIQNALQRGSNGMPPISGQNSFSCSPACTQPITLPLTFPATSLGTNAITLDYYQKQPYLIQWNITAEHKLAGNFLLNAGYVGTRGVHLLQAMELNPVLPTSVNNGIPFWDPAILAGPEKAGCTSIVPTCRQNKNFGSILGTTSRAESTYRALQIGINKALSRGLQFQASYVWSLTQDDSQGILADSSGQFSDALFTKRFDWGPSPFDATHNFRLNTLYYIPGMKAKNLAAKLTQGWWMGNIVSVQTGYPFSPMTNYAALSGLGPASCMCGGERASYVTSANLAAAQAINPAAVVYDANTVILGNPNHWFNGNMFTAPIAGTHSDVPRNTLRTPGITNWDLSFNKDTAIPFLGEGGKLQFRAEIFNLLNHPNFGLPNGVVANSPTAIAATAGLISNTTTSSRQVQLGLKLIF